ncbi:hypothetical protein B0H16DRAFT_1471317 [Mycena metata]|uniref:Uncharacterized protein n=1 Tax=Mycena metata TaxID=1033252 RepID=A0AAD7HSP1_9AGAR|nr:hypothetical protein B0H16DRAFT_1471317 [Mycena metata]
MFVVIIFELTLVENIEARFFIQLRSVNSPTLHQWLSVLKYSRYYVQPSVVPNLQRFNSNPWSASFNAPERPSPWPLEPKQTETVAVWNQVYRVNDRIQLCSSIQLRSRALRGRCPVHWDMGPRLDSSFQGGLDNPAQMAHSPWIPTATHCASMAPRIVLSTANRSSTRASRVSRGWSNLEFPIIVFGLRQSTSSSSPILVPAPPGNPTQPSATDSGTRRSTRKRKERDDLKEIQAALEACICGTSAAPEDGVDLANVAQCKHEACETKWSLRSLGL